MTRFLGWFIFLLLVRHACATGHQPAPCNAWSTVASWNATFSLSGSGTNQNGGSTFTVDYDFNGSGTLTLVNINPDGSGKVSGAPVQTLMWQTNAVVPGCGSFRNHHLAMLYDDLCR